MNVAKCIPFVGTFVSGCECVNALIHGDVRGCLWKGMETVIDGVLDATMVMTGGLSSLATAPLKTVGKKAAIFGVSTATKAVAVHIFYHAAMDHVNPGRNNSKHYGPLFGQSRSESNRKSRSSPPRQQGSKNSTNNARSTTADDFSDDEDPSKRINHIKKTCQQPIRLLRTRYYQKKAAQSLPEKFDPTVQTIQEGNERLIERMLHYVEVMHHREFGKVPVPEAATRKIFEVIRESHALNNFYEWNRDCMVVQVDEVFSGVKADGSQGSVTFTIDADIPLPGSRQTPHVGITIERENSSFRTFNHAFVTERIPYGRPGFDQNQSHTHVFIAKDDETRIDGGSFKHQVKVTMLRKKPSPP